MVIYLKGRRNRSVGTATSYGHDVQEYCFWQGQAILSLLHRTHTVTEVHPAPCVMGIGGSLSGMKRQGRKGTLSSPCSAEGETDESIRTSTPSHSCMAYKNKLRGH
jgi:hypothetical protein